MVEQFYGTNVGRPIIGIRPEDAASLEERIADLQLVETSITMFTGHKVYESRNGAGNYIISGSMLVRYVNGDIDSSLYDFLREEGGTQRIRVFDSEEAASHADELQKTGQALIAGTQPPLDRAIILNGSLVEGQEFTINHLDQLLVPIDEVFSSYAYNAGYKAGVGAVISYNQTGYFFPTRSTTAPYQETYSVSAGMWTYTNSDLENFWSDQFYCVWDGGRVEMETLERILGWTYEVKDNMLIITSSAEDMYPVNVVRQEKQFQDYDVYYPEDVELRPESDGEQQATPADEGGEDASGHETHESDSLPPSGEG